MWFHFVLDTIDKRRAGQSYKEYWKYQTKVYVTTCELRGSLLLPFTCRREEDVSSGEEEVKEEVIGNDQDVDDSAMDDSAVEDDGGDKSSQEEDIEKIYDLKHYDSEEEDGPENMAGNNYKGQLHSISKHNRNCMISGCR